ncbi:bifunctional 4-hydroxy-2-oxoglutarate aldolase/2-dehydro-3-deoxy-phosphogluconate aldolase [Aliikangiella sp. IMCC44359]|uniref:bifunctional 4-hydroxy-2-oxoglutarate aldolase/2-dehydro-3-deoxy-phosphogluconate aldolase n=1 Tax=Aliikangiella sp. IMCC44359 TaxID=3459125 RepID=UPI00403B2FBD
MMNNSIEHFLKISPVIPVIVIDSVEHALPLAQALLDGGIAIMEITLRTPTALSAIKTIRENFPQMTVGAGTVNNVNLIEKSVDAKSQFLVSPGSTKSLLDAARYHHIPLLPGISTPTEAMVLQDAGFDFLKFFPAEAAGGTTMLKALAGPLSALKFCPTGGITPQNYQSYLAIENVICVGCSWMTEKKLIENEQWQEITQRTKEILALLKTEEN